MNVDERGAAIRVWPGFVLAPTQSKEGNMQRIDAHYLYQIGTQIYPLSTLNQNMTRGECFFPIIVAESAVETLVERSIFKLKTSVAAGRALVSALRAFRESAHRPEEKIDFYELYTITNAYGTFAAVLGAELSILDIYLVSLASG